MADELIPQSHGGALRPFTPATGAAAGRSSIKAIRKAGLALLATGTEQASQVLLDALRSEDERVRTVAATQILDRVLGRPGEKPHEPADEEEQELDLSNLTDEELAELRAAITVSQNYVAISRQRRERGVRSQGIDYECDPTYNPPRSANRANRR
jgi:hypothetical protein